MIQVTDNFFQDLDYFHHHIKNISMYDQDEYNRLNNSSDTWPGYRSFELFDTEPFLGFLFRNEFKRNFPGVNINGLNINLHLHLRPGTGDQQPDWIHRDPNIYSCLVYLNDTNYQSGTQMFHKLEEGYRLINDVRYVKNTAVVFDANIEHRSSFNFGEDVNNGRLTLNAFFYEN
jgi:hypothetical protein